MIKILVLVGSLLLTCCSNVKSEPKNVSKISANTTSVPTSIPTSLMNLSGIKKEFQPNFISAAKLLKKINAQEKVYIFDVRNKESYDESHIKTAQNRPIPIISEAVKGIPKDAQIVTYCGCPHHLSSLGAEDLTKLGYKDVHVLNEGFWFWKDNKYPLEIATGSKSTLTEISVQGMLTKKQKPFANMDIYMKHEKSGQLEATRTDANGGYKLYFHLYNYKNNDKFKFYVGDLKTPVQEFSTDKKETTNVVVNIP